MKKCLSLILLLLLCLGVSACAGQTEPSPPSSGSDSPSSVSPSSAAELGPDGRFPLEKWSYITSFSDPLPEDGTLQIVCKDDTAARLARAVKPLEWFVASVNAPSFDSDHPLDADLAARIAFDNTPRLDLSLLGDYPNHPVVKRIDQLREEEHVIICDVIYADDAAAALERLFGVTGWEHHTVDYYNYFPEEGVYITYGDLIRGWGYPQLLSWEETENGYTCELILADTRTESRYGTVNGQELTEENIQEIAAREAHYSFTFDMISGEPVVTSFAQTQESLPQQAERLVDDYLWSGTPKAQAVGMIENATLYERIPQYQYENGTLEPLENSDHYPVAANGKVFGIFMDMHDAELGSSQSFSSEYADQLNAFTEQNDQVCIIYDGMRMYLASPTDYKLVYDMGDEPERADSFEKTRPSLDGLELWNAKERVSLGGLYFDPETWAENWDSVPQSWKDAISGTDSPSEEVQK